jgi:hypothetical protein
MFLTLDVVRRLIGIITALMTYFWLVPVLGCFRAWVAKKMGDDTPEMLGFLTLDPFTHVDMIGFTVLFLFGVGWGVNIPIYLNNIQGRFEIPRRLLALFSDAILGFFIAVLAAVIAMAWGYSYKQLLVAGTQPPSMVVALQYLLVSTLNFSMFLMIISIVQNSATYIVWLASHRTSFYNPTVQLFFLFGPLFIYIIFGNLLYEALFLGVGYLSTLILHLIGIR